MPTARCMGRATKTRGNRPRLSSLLCPRRSRFSREDPWWRLFGSLANWPAGADSFDAQWAVCWLKLS